MNATTTDAATKLEWAIEALEIGFVDSRTYDVVRHTVRAAEMVTMEHARAFVASLFEDESGMFDLAIEASEIMATGCAEDDCDGRPKSSIRTHCIHTAVVVAVQDSIVQRIKDEIEQALSAAFLKSVKEVLYGTPNPKVGPSTRDEEGGLR